MKLEIPKELGDIVESCEVPDSENRVIIILSGFQDSFDTEKAIAFLLEYLVVNNGLELAMLGDKKKGSGYIDSSILMTIPTHTTREDTADYAMRKGHIGGAEHLAITSEGAIAVYGVEKRNLFLQIMAAQFTGKPTFDLLKKRQASIVEETLKYMGTEEKNLAALTVKDFDLDEIRTNFRSKKVTHHIIRPTTTEDEAANKEKARLIRRLKRETGYTGRLLSIREEGALKELTDALENLREYTPVKLIGRGCFKKTIQMTTSSGRSLALKIIDLMNISERAKENLRRMGFEDPVEAFKKERERIARIEKRENPHIAMPLGDVQVEQCYFFLEEYSEETLLPHVRDNHPLDPSTVNQYALQLADGLTAVHSEGLYHGDLHPDNILIDFEYGIRITDFDVCASMFDHDHDQRYMVPHAETRAPELYEGHDLDYRVDIWSFGVNVVFMKTGKMPFPKSFEGSPEDWEDLSEEERLSHRNHVHECIKDDQWYGKVMETIDQEFEPGLAGVLKRCLERDPNKRFQNAVELYEAITSVVQRD